MKRVAILLIIGTALPLAGCMAPAGSQFQRGSAAYEFRSQNMIWDEELERRRQLEMRARE